MAEKKGIYFGDEAVAFLGEITSRSVNRAIDRYRELIGRIKLDRLFSDHELDILRDISRGTIFEPAGMIRGALAADFADSDYLLEENAGEAEQVLLKKLRSLSFVEEMATVELLEREARERRSAQPG